MIKLERDEVMNLHNAIRGARNPLNSWHRMDSHYCHEDDFDCEDCYYNCNADAKCLPTDFSMGKNDLDLAKRLSKAGSDHGKFLRQIFVSVDITAPLYWWKEFDAYKIGTVSNSCSTMHRIHSKEFTLDDFSCEDMVPSTKQILWLTIIPELNELRDRFNKEKDKQIWYSMIQLLPSSYNQMRTISLNYEVLKNMYHARKHHKLTEWHTFCEWVETLPYAKELIVDAK